MKAGLFENGEEVIPSVRAKYPGRTPAQRRALDAIGCGNYSPIMSRATRDALLRNGLIVEAGEKIIGSGPFAVHVKEYVMPIPVHMQWCRAVAAEYEGGAEEGSAG